MAAPLNVGMIGFGNIGAGVLRALESNSKLVDERVPHPIRVVRIADIDTTTKRNAPYDPAILSADTDGLLADPAVHVALELTGTIGPAREFIERALQAGKHVVTANKALIAQHGTDLLRLAVKNKVCFLFEAAVGGGIPLIRTLHQGLAANDIQAVRGIINGTANYILSRMTDEGVDFAAVLADAQRLGYAEPDPTFDVEGHDTAHKLAILATLCFNQDIRFDDIHREGIVRVSAVDIAYAKQVGYTIKLLGIAKKNDDGSVEARVHPTLLPADSRLASVNGVFNAVRIDGNLTGSVILSGRGAGPEPTSSAILSDLMTLASGKAEGGLRREMRLSIPTDPKRIRPMAELRTRYYVRLGLRDVAGALAQVLTVLGSKGVSIESMNQPGGEDKGHAHVLIVTHEAQEACVQESLREVQKLEINRAEPFLLRIEDMG
ncbi:homoserine dehydrogenase [Candidatus Sumerlaeota bacterium]|nr:homoserine dehydrogenase [Candidatus Sumerlaeota bacterium]